MLQKGAPQQQQQARQSRTTTSPQPQPQPQLPTVIMYPLKSVAPLYGCLGNQKNFNDLRVHLVGATYYYLTALPQPPPLEFLNHVYCWVTEDGRYLAYDRMPQLLDNNVMNELNRHGLIGIYWLVNHHDLRGSFSRGQIYDMEIALHKIKDHVSPEAAPIVEQLRRFLDLCVDKSTPVYMEPAPPLPQPRQPPPQPLQASPSSPSPFAYIEQPLAQQPLAPLPPQPVGETTGLSVGEILRNLKPLLQYDPANPSSGLPPLSPLSPLPPLASSPK
jgi:hypothetical protein